MSGQRHKAAEWGFFGTILVLLLVVGGLVTAALLRPAPEPPVLVAEKPQRTIPQSRIALMVAGAAEAAEARIARARTEALTAVFAPVHAAVPAYADIHYSVIGEYAELTTLAFGNMQERLRNRLYDGFDSRLGAAIFRIDSAWANAFEDELDSRLTAEVGQDAILSPLTQAALDDLSRRAVATVPLGAVAATAGGAAGAKIVAATAMKAMTKTAGKGAAKTLGKLSGLGGGALVGAPLGPVGMAIGGAIGAVVAWFAVDAVVIEVDQWLTRDAFEAELHRLVDQHRLALSDEIDRILDARATDLVAGTLRDRLERQE